MQTQWGEVQTESGARRWGAQGTTVGGPGTFGYPDAGFCESSAVIGDSLAANICSFTPFDCDDQDGGPVICPPLPCSVPAMSVPFPVSPIGDSGVSDAGAFVLAETALNMHCWGRNPVVTAKLQLNGQDRFSEREGSYFDTVQPFQHHTRGPDTGINVYSFAIRPEEHQPSGTCNFSRIDNATLQLVLSTNAIGGDHTAKVRVYATNYNVLRIMSGMGGLAYSN
jgi:hypothetical protein